LIKKLREDEKKEEVTKEVEKKITEKETKKTQREELEYNNAPDIGGRKSKGDKKEIDYDELGYTEDDVPDLE